LSSDWLAHWADTARLDYEADTTEHAAMLTYGLPILFTIIVWWGSTGAILYLNGLPRATFKWSLTALSVLALAALGGLWLTSTDTSASAAYWAFVCGLTVWSWPTAAFYFGYLAGPRTTEFNPTAGPTAGVSRFRAATETMAYQEAVYIFGAVLVYALTAGGHQFGLWTYLVLWAMHTSGKLNMFFGVPNLSEEFFPPHLSYLTSYMRHRPMNLLFPLSVTVATIISLAMIRTAGAAPPGSVDATGWLLLGTLIGLGVIEHWFLVLPIPAMALWNWSLSSRTVGKNSAGQATNTALPSLPLKCGQPHLKSVK
jgi:putative photosynthetic complex assembly protein 2